MKYVGDDLDPVTGGQHFSLYMDYHARQFMVELFGNMTVTFTGKFN